MGVITKIYPNTYWKVPFSNPNKGIRYLGSIAAVLPVIEKISKMTTISRTLREDFAFNRVSLDYYIM